ncbi:RNA-directed DNA polymerase from mobile element jockey-like protein [Willisornis vidua]|uniref:RNA-directed DNA polymerase from mobile element jockey-like protein n=1 Tax=Willisornis vidua TaxID=1566151 RepID=A0ABQ9CVS8_9PASS|nr:RNA-directed DNA polymerase from mobile element jockey-like protein [Willisornis vidua]
MHHVVGEQLAYGSSTEGDGEWGTSDCRPVTSGDPWGSILGPVLSNIFVNNLDAGLEGILSKFADGTKLAGAVDSLKGRETLHRDLDKLKGCAITNCMKLNRRKCWIPNLGWDNPRCTHRLGNEMLGISALGKDLGVLVDGKLNISQQCPGSQRANCVLGGIRHIIARQSRQRIFSLCSALGQPHLEGVQFRVPQYKKDIKLSESIQRRTTKTMKGLEGKAYEERLRALGLFSLEERRLRGDITAIYNSLIRESGGVDTDLFSVMTNDRN